METEKYNINPSNSRSSGRSRTGPKDFFLYFAQIVTLYVSAGSLIVLLFGIVNFLVVDPAAGSFYYYGGYSGGIRFAIASLIIIFPLYLFLAWYARREVLAHSEKLSLWVRVWFIYITLFITGCALVGDLVVVLNSFLGGELSLRFFLKILAVFIVAGSVFGYYFYDLRRSGRGEKGVRVSLVWAAGLIVFGALVTGFIVMGSPFEQRAYRLDDDRVSDLSQIQWEVVNYWQNKEVLPDSLTQLEDDLRGFRVPVDPVTGKAYVYRAVGNLSFELCGTFDMASREELKGRGPYPIYEFSGTLPEDNGWEHEAGEVCFERTIDEDFYPRVKQVL